MKLINNRLLRLFFLSLITAVLLYQSGIIKNILNPSSTAYAEGDLEIDWGFVSHQAIFKILNFMPGDSESHTVKITNNASISRHIGLTSKKTLETGNFSKGLKITISKDGVVIYGPKSLFNFFNDSDGPDYLDFYTLSSGQTANFIFTVDFPPESPNKYQNKTVVFNLTIGMAFEMPLECLVGGRKYENVIFGTERRDILNGTNKNDVILGFEGDDIINGSNGDDCLIGGDGNDTILGSNGNDKIYGGNGNDRLDGSNGDDYIEGGSGNDNMSGGNGNDILLGGLGTDRADGELGRDRCEAETKIKCEY